MQGKERLISKKTVEAAAFHVPQDKEWVSVCEWVGIMTLPRAPFVHHECYIWQNHKLILLT